jgi:hypothetical protein
MFTFRERFVASDAWMRLWLLSCVVFALYLLFKSLEPSVSALRSPVFLLLTVFAVAATIILTLLVSPFVACAIFDGMIERQTRRNGGPFSIGDRVVVIAGPCSGKAGVITSYGQCQTLQITLDGEEAEHGSYSHYQLKRAGGQCDERESPIGVESNG